MHSQFPIMSEGTVAPQFHAMFQCDCMHFTIQIMKNFVPRANQGWKVGQPPHVEICDKQRLIDVGRSGGQYGA